PRPRGAEIRGNGARVLAFDKGQRRSERLRSLRAAVSAGRVCVARGTQGRQTAQRLPRGRQRHAHHGGSRQDAAPEERPPRRSRGKAPAAGEKTIQLADALSPEPAPAGKRRPPPGPAILGGPGPSG